MRSVFLAIIGQAYTTVAFPGLAALALAPNGPNINPRQSLPSNLPLSADEGNSGPIPSLLFDPVDQLVNVAPGTPNQYVAPQSTDERGPCPGLNAAANHGFLPHNGIPNIPQSELLRKISIKGTAATLLTHSSYYWPPGSLWSRPRVWSCTGRDCHCFDWWPDSPNLVYWKRVLSWNPDTGWPAH
jgi:hypothetical protein